MGLFITDDGHYQGWLAAFLCCCAAVNDDEAPINKPPPMMRPIAASLCDQQPVPLTALPPTPISQPQPVVLNNGSRETLLPCSPKTRPATAPQRPPSIEPLKLGESFLPTASAQRGRRKSSPVRSIRPSISAPSGFRRIDMTADQRQSLVPLRLGPVVLRESPIPSCDNPNVKRSSADVNRPGSESTVDLRHSFSNLPSSENRCDGPVSSSPSRGRVSSHTPAADIRPQSADRQSFQRHSLPRRASSGSIRARLSDTSAPPLLTSRLSSERLRPKRKRSHQSLRRYGEAEDPDLEMELLELNTIVEERRTEALSPGAVSPDKHVPAVAPSMQITARSETLDAIGSALSRPRTPHRKPSVQTNLSDSENPQPSSLARTSSRTRVSGWLSSIMTNGGTAPASTGEPFYKCQPPTTTAAHKHTRDFSTTTSSSFSTNLTELDSPSLTVASSPITKATHSRSQTGESVMLQLSSPPAISRGVYYYTDASPDAETAKKHVGAGVTHGPEIVDPPSPSPSQVGLAF